MFWSSLLDNPPGKVRGASTGKSFLWPLGTRRVWPMTPWVQAYDAPAGYNLPVLRPANFCLADYPKRAPRTSTSARKDKREMKSYDNSFLTQKETERIVHKRFKFALP